MAASEDNELIEFDLVSERGVRHPATLAIEVVPDDDDDKCQYTLTWESGTCSIESSADFYALCELREKLAEQGLAPCCYGAAENVYPSGMSISMGGGRKAYQLTIGKPARMEDLVDIFESELGLVPVSIEQQRAFFDRWLETPRD